MCGQVFIAAQIPFALKMFCLRVRFLEYFCKPLVFPLKLNDAINPVAAIMATS